MRHYKFISDAEFDFEGYPPERRCICGNKIARTSGLSCCQICAQKEFVARFQARPSDHRPTHHRRQA